MPRTIGSTQETTAMSTTPLLESVIGSNSKSRRNGGLLTSVKSFMPHNFFFGTSSAYEGISLMLNSTDPQERDELTKGWRDHKIEELNFVGTVGALLASCLSSTSAWPDVLNNGQDKPWTVRALNFSGLLFALFAVGIAGLQTMRLHRLSSHRDGLKKIRAGLAREKTSEGWRPHKFQVYAWEASQAFLVTSVALMVTGIAVLVWVSTGYGPKKPEDAGWWDENSKMAVTFTSVLGFVLVVLVASQAALKGTDDEHLED